MAAMRLVVNVVTSNGELKILTAFCKRPNYTLTGVMNVHAVKSTTVLCFSVTVWLVALLLWQLVLSLFVVMQMKLELLLRLFDTSLMKQDGL